MGIAGFVGRNGTMRTIPKSVDTLYASRFTTQG
jgi:hypothetical protein